MFGKSRVSFGRNRRGASVSVLLLSREEGQSLGAGQGNGSEFKIPF